MADLIAYQDGNWTGATTWKTVSTGANAKQATTTSSTNTLTTYLLNLVSSITIANGEVLEGLLMHCARVNTTGTVTVGISDNSGSTWVREVTVNASDLPTNASWVFFKFGTTLTGDGGTDYKVGVKASSTGNATFWRDGTTGNWARYIRTNTTATIATTDVTFICDELTGAGTKNDITVTMDSTASTTYGEVNIGQGGVLSYGTSASTNYILDLGGNLNVWPGGTLNIGTSGTRIPSTSTAVLEFTMGTNVLYGLEARSGSTVNIYGATKDNTKTLLTADAASGQAVINVTSTSGWAANDEVALASTTRTAGQSEKRTVSTINSGTQATLSTNLTNTHHGSGDYVGEVVNLTRNVKIRGTSQTLCAYVNCAATSSFTASYAEFYWLGSGTALKRGVQVGTTSSGTFSATFCSFYDYFATSSTGVSFTGTTGSHTLDDCVFLHTSSGNPIELVATSGAPSIQRNHFIATQGTASFSDLGGTIKDNRFGGCGVTFSESGATIGTIKDNVQHSATTGITLGTGSPMLGTIDGLTVWRNSFGISLAASGVTLTNISSYHNTSGNIATGSSGAASGVTILNSSFNGGSGASLSASSEHFRNATPTVTNIVFDNCSFGPTTQATRAFNITSANLTNIVLRKCTVAEASVVNSQSNLLSGSFGESSVAFDKFNNTSGSHRTYKRYGRTEADQATYKTAAPSEALLPNTSGQKLPSGSKKLAVASGTTATVKAWVNKSASYNGNQPRLIVKANSIAGIASDTVLDTMSVGTGTWEELSGTTATVSDDCVLEVFVDCDGTAGTVYVDDWSVT